MKILYNYLTIEKKVMHTATMEELTPTSDLETTKTPSASSDQTSHDYAGFGRRFLAYMIDSLVLSLLGFVLGASFNVTNIYMGNSNTASFLWLPSILLSAGYYILFWMKDGQTLGNKLLAIKVVREDAKPLDIATGIIRYIGYIISSFILWLGFLWVIWDRKKQGWHDKMAGTVVVKTNGKPHIAIAITILVAISFFFVLLFVGLLAAGILFYNQAKKNPNFAKKLSKQTNQSLTQSEANALARNTFTTLNAYRAEKSLPQLTEDNRLCAYAQRRLQQLAELGKFDDGKGFYEDLANPTLKDAYFTGLGYVAEHSASVTFASEPETIVSQWTKSEKSFANNAIYKKGCVRADTQSIVVIAGEPKE